MFKLVLQWCVLSCATLACVNVGMASAAEKPVKVMASIKPLQLIAASLLQDSAEVDLLISADNSPHHYNMKPSDVRRMQEVDLIVWVGPDLERFLMKPLRRTEDITLTLMPEEEAKEEEHDEHEDHHEDEHKDEHGHDEHADHHDEHKDEHDEHEGEGEEHHHDHAHGSDPHLWMAPETILAAAEKITARLQADYPARSAEFADRLAKFKARLEHTDHALADTLKPEQGKGFYVFHDAFGSYVEHYGLKQLGYFTVDPGRKPGAKRLNEIRTALESNKADCVFVEPQFEAPVVNAIVGDLPINKGTLDPLGRDIVADADGIFNFLNGLGAELKSCLKKS